MRKLKDFGVIIYFCTLLVFGLSEEASAYIDPGTGSMIIQIFIAGVISASVALKVFWKKIKSFFTNKKEQDSQS